MTSWSVDAVEGLLYSVGFRGTGWRTMTSIALAESGGNDAARGRNGPTQGCPQGSIDRGLFQINDCYHAEVDDAIAFDPLAAAKTVAAMTGRGAHDFTQWATYTSGRFRDYFTMVDAAYYRWAWGYQWVAYWTWRDGHAGDEARSRAVAALEASNAPASAIVRAQQWQQPAGAVPVPQPIGSAIPTTTGPVTPAELYVGSTTVAPAPRPSAAGSEAVRRLKAAWANMQRDFRSIRAHALSIEHTNGANWDA